MNPPILILSLLLFVGGLLFRRQLVATPGGWADYAIFLSAWLLCGWPVITSALRKLVRRELLDEAFLMTVATFGAVILGELPEAAAVMLFYQIGEHLQGRAVGQSRRDIRALLEAQPKEANLLIDGEVRRVPPESVEPGQIIQVRAGEKCPLDGEILSGSSRLDLSSLTGESVPVSAGIGDSVLAGSINGEGVLNVRVTRPFRESSIARIMDLVTDASARKGNTERFITQLARFYTPVVVGIAVLTAFVPPLLVGGSLAEWGYRALIMLVVSCPCAFVVSIPLSYLCGLGAASRRGVLVKGAVFLDVLHSVKAVVFDKTGTLTKGVFRVTATHPAEITTEDELLRTAAVAEASSSHPIASAILDAWGGEVPVRASVVREMAGKGMIVEVSDGEEVLAGNAALLADRGIDAAECDEGGSVVHVASGGRYLGWIVISDELRPESASVVRELRDHGIGKIGMLSGDSHYVARTVSTELKLDAFRAELLPEEKVNALEEMTGAIGGKVAFVGDGINDAPALARADVGIAVGGFGNDVAMEAADVVLISPSPSGVVDALRIASRTRRAVWQNIVFAAGVKIGVMLLAALGVANMWEAIFADVGVALLAVTNASRILRR